MYWRKWGLTAVPCEANDTWQMERATLLRRVAEEAAAPFSDATPFTDTLPDQNDDDWRIVDRKDVVLMLRHPRHLPTNAQAHTPPDKRAGVPREEPQSDSVQEQLSSNMERHSTFSSHVQGAQVGCGATCGSLDCATLDPLVPVGHVAQDTQGVQQDSIFQVRVLIQGIECQVVDAFVDGVMTAHAYYTCLLGAQVSPARAVRHLGPAPTSLGFVPIYPRPFGGKGQEDVEVVGDTELVSEALPPLLHVLKRLDLKVELKSASFALPVPLVTERESGKMTQASLVMLDLDGLVVECLELNTLQGQEAPEDSAWSEDGSMPLATAQPENAGSVSQAGLQTGRLALGLGANRNRRPRSISIASEPTGSTGTAMGGTGDTTHATPVADQDTAAVTRRARIKIEGLRVRTMHSWHDTLSTPVEKLDIELEVSSSSAALQPIACNAAQPPAPVPAVAQTGASSGEIGHQETTVRVCCSLVSIMVRNEEVLVFSRLLHKVQRLRSSFSSHASLPPHALSRQQESSAGTNHGNNSASDNIRPHTPHTPVFGGFSEMDMEGMRLLSLPTDGIDRSAPNALPTAALHAQKRIDADVLALLGQRLNLNLEFEGLQVCLSCVDMMQCSIRYSV